jgi:hypothetical protein
MSLTGESSFLGPRDGGIERGEPVFGGTTGGP